MFHLKISLNLLRPSAGARHIHRWVAPTLKILKAREKVKLPVDTRRSGYLEWNFNAELFAFAKRLNEDFNRDLLQQAFTDRSFIIAEEKKQKDLGVDEPVLNLKDNFELAQHGDELISNYVRAFVSFSFPKLPVEGIRAFRDYLGSDQLLAHVSSHLGTKDIILSSQATPDEQLLASTFRAVVSALQRTSGDERAFEFVRDFVLTMLNQKDLNEVWVIERPFEYLKTVWKGEIEPRDIGNSGKNTILACYRVGLYSDKKFMSQGFGENVQMAIDAAALDALNRLFNMEETRAPLNFKVTLKDVLERKESSRVRA